MSIVVRDERLARGRSRARATTGEGGATSPAARTGSGLLRWSLRAVDAAALAISWAVTDLFWPTSSSPGTRLVVGLLPFVVVGC